MKSWFFEPLDYQNLFSFPWSHWNFFKFPLGLSQQENGKKAQIPKRKTKLSISLILWTPKFVKSSFSQEVQKIIVPLCYLM